MLLGDLYREKFEYGKAAQYYQQAYTLNPNNVTFSIRTADMAMLQGNPQQALKWYKKALLMTPSEWLTIKYSQALSQVKGKEPALAYLKEALNKSGGDVIRIQLLTMQLEMRKENAISDYHSYIRSKINRQRVAGFIKLLGQEDLTRDSLNSLVRWLLKAYLKIYSASEILALLVPVSGSSSVTPAVTAVVVSYNMDRELPRTLLTLQAPYQQGLDPDDIEIILIDNGSKNIPAPDQFPNIRNLKIVSFPFKTHSPVQALNLGIHLAKANLVGVFIDGARMASPGLLKNALRADRLSDNTVVATLGFHLGPEVQMTSVAKGYNQAVEDRLLEHIRWQEDGYRLFSISSLAGSSAGGYFKPIAESNALFLSKNQWRKLGGVDERFITPGGGYANLDLYKRACVLPGNKLVILLNEGTFHQVHGGVATNSQRDDATQQIFTEEYQKIRGSVYRRPDTQPLYLGQYIPASASVLKYSIEQASGYEDVNIKASDSNKELNRILLDSTYCSLFDTDKSVSDQLIDSPIIVTGRGGSGTRLLSQLIQNMNIFMGNDINETEDSIEWVGPIYDMVINRIQIEHDTFEMKHIRRLRNNAENILQKSDIHSGLWGFKLPETMMCLPELKQAFPSARFIHLTRHPVGISMRRTHMTSRSDNPVGKRVLEDAYRYIGNDPGSIAGGVDEVNNSVSWNYQLSKAVSFFSDLSEGEDFIQVKYEDILSCPDKVLGRLCEFLDLNDDCEHNLELDSDRTNSISEQNQMTDLVWSVCEEVATRIGYKKHEY
nr:sulfotransferase [Amphritea pacifica]